MGTNSTVSHIEGDTFAYRISNGYEWGTVYVRPLSGKYQGAEVTANSSFGVYGYTWTHMGEPWQSFLPDIDMHYAMQKMAGRAFHVPTDKTDWLEAQRTYIKDRLAEDEGHGWLSSKQKTMYAKLSEALDQIDRDDDIFHNCSPEIFFREYARLSNGFAYNEELYSIGHERVNPQVIGFWDKIWLPFTAALKPEVRVDA